MQVDLLCSGSKGNSCLIRTQTTTLMIDCGAPTKKYEMEALNKVNCAIDSIDAILITHNHSDHIKQLRHFASRPIYSQCELRLKDTKKNPVPLDHHHIRPWSAFLIQDVRIFTIGLSHDAGDTIGFVIEADGEKLVYITDTGYVRLDAIPYLKDADYYIFESNHDIDMLMHTSRPEWLKQRITSDTGHLCNQQSAQILCSCLSSRTKEVVLAHLSEEANTPELALKTLKEKMEEKGIDDSGLRIRAAAPYEITSFGSLHPTKSGNPVRPALHSPVNVSSGKI